MPEKLPIWQNRHVLGPLVRPFYRKYPFHNFQHAMEATNQALDIAKTALRQGIEIDTSIFPLAGYGHDTGIWLKPTVDHPFATKEAFSADIAWRIGKALDMPKPKLTLACEVIESSGPDKPCASLEAKAFRQGDLKAGGLLSGPTVFLNGTYRLYQESKMINGGRPTLPLRPLALIGELANFGYVCHDTVGRLVSEDLSLGDYDRDDQGRSLFGLQAAYNLSLLTPRLMTDFLNTNLADVINYPAAGV